MEVQAGPGEPVGDMVQILPRKPIMPDAYKEDQYRQSQAEDIASANDVMRGQGSSERQTATEVERLLQQGNARHALQVLYLEYTFKKEILHRTWELLRMRMTKAQRVKVGEEYKDVDLTSIQEPVDIVVGGGLFAMSKAARISMDQELVSLLQIPQFAQVAKPDAIFRQLLMDRGWRSPERFILSPDEIAKQQQQQQVQQVLQQATQEAQNAPPGGGQDASSTMGGPPPATAGPGGGAPPMPGMSAQGSAQSMVGPPFGEGPVGQSAGGLFGG
jgi:hypothetical protein